MIAKTQYPNFQKGSALKSDDLNNIVKAFRNDDTSIRKMLGYGIVEGLDFISKDNKLYISAGVAFAPDGTFLFLENDFDISKMSEGECFYLAPLSSQEAGSGYTIAEDDCSCKPQSAFSAGVLEFSAEIRSKKIEPCTIKEICILRWCSYELVYNAEKIKKSIESIVKGYQDTAKCYSACFDKDIFVNLEKKLTELEKYYVKAPDNQNTINICKAQYFYDYLKDLIAAQEEFLQYAASIRRTTEPGIVYLGKAILDECTPNFCREEFNHFHDEEKAKFYACRMIELANTEVFGLPELPKEVADIERAVANIVEHPIRITPSAALSAPLSERAIPFYLKDTIRDFWNYELTQNGRQNTIPRYESAANNHLKCDLAKYDFFRVEGYCDMELTSAIRQIQCLRTLLNIDFDIKIVGIDNNTTSCLSTYYEDLQCQYAMARQQFYCQTLPVITGQGATIGTGASPNLLPLLLSGYNNPDKTNCCYFPFEILKTEFDKRREDLIFSNFKTKNTGLEHFAGVPNGGTLVLVVELQDFQQDEIGRENIEAAVAREVNFKVIADFALSHRCCDNDHVIDCLLESEIGVLTINSIPPIYEVSGDFIFQEWRENDKIAQIGGNTLQGSIKEGKITFAAMNYCYEDKGEFIIPQDVNPAILRVNSVAAPREIRTIQLEAIAEFKVIKENTDSTKIEKQASILENLVNGRGITSKNLAEIKVTKATKESIKAFWQPVSKVLEVRLNTEEFNEEQKGSITNEINRINEQLV